MWRLWWEDGGNCANVRVYASNQVCFANILPLEADHKELGAVRVEKEGSKKKKKIPSAFLSIPLATETIKSIPSRDTNYSAGAFIFRTWNWGARLLGGDCYQRAIIDSGSWYNVPPTLHSCRM